MEHCVEVFDHYKTAMGYKALTHRFRLAIDLPEPFTMEDVLDALSESIESIEEKDKAERDAGRTKVKNSEVCTAEEAAVEAPTEGAVEAPQGSAAERTAGELEVPHKDSADECMPTTGLNAIVSRACGEVGKILETLQKRNRKKGRHMGRSMGALDEILHGKLKLLHVPRSA